MELINVTELGLITALSAKKGAKKDSIPVL